MADKSGQADIRGLDIQRMATGFADEETVMKKFVTVAKTKARQIRWYQKTAGFLASPDAEALTADQIANAAEGALPVITEPSFTRNTSYIKPFFVEGPLVTLEDIKDTDIDVFATMIRDLTLAVVDKVDKEIYWIISDSTTHGTPASGSSVPSAAGTADGWDDAVTGDPIKDILAAKESIRTYRYNPEGAIMLLHPGDYSSLIEWLINVKGSSIPGFSSEKVKSGIVHEILGVRVVVSTQFDEDYATIFLPHKTAKWKSFMPLTTAIVDEPLIGKKIRVKEEGVCLLENPNSAYVITNIKV
jgi:hypothetical protein